MPDIIRGRARKGAGRAPRRGELPARKKSPSDLSPSDGARMRGRDLSPSDGLPDLPTDRCVGWQPKNRLPTAVPVRLNRCTGRFVPVLAGSA